MSERERTAYHESGHAVAALRLGAHVDLVVLESHAEPGELPGGAVGVVHRRALAAGTHCALAREAVIKLAGLEAERRLIIDGRPWADENDWRYWWPRQLARERQIHDFEGAYLGGLDPREPRWWDSFVECTVNLLGLCWADVDTVARRLLRVGRLEGGEVLELIGRPTSVQEGAAGLLLQQAMLRAAPRTCRPPARPLRLPQDQEKDVALAHEWSWPGAQSVVALACSRTSASF